MGLRRIRPPLPLLLSVAGGMTWVLAPDVPLTLIALMLCPGWGLTRVVSSIDRNFGVLGSSLCLSIVVLGLTTRAAGALGIPSTTLGPALHGLSIGLCLLGTLRLGAYDRWLARQPPHPAPMLPWPRYGWWCSALTALTLAAVAWAHAPGRPPAGAAGIVEAARAAAWLDGPGGAFVAGVALPRHGLLAPAAAGLAAGSGAHVLVAVPLLVLSCLAATFALLAEGISRLWGNRGGLQSMFALLLGLNPLAAFFVLRSTTSSDPTRALAGIPLGLDPTTTTGLNPFIEGTELAVTLALTAMLVFTTMSVLRRASFHVPRLIGLAAFGLTVSHPTAAMLMLPGWILGAVMSYLACRGSPDNDPRPDNPARRPGEPLRLRAPFWRLAVPVALGALVGFALVDPIEFTLRPSSVKAWTLLCVIGPTLPFFMPGVRHLNASPGREAFFFVGLIPVSILLGIGLSPIGSAGSGELIARLLAVLLVVPCANGAMKLVELHGTPARVVLALLVLVLLPAPLHALWSAAHRPRPFAWNPNGSLTLASADADWPLALSYLAKRAPQRAVALLADPPGLTRPTVHDLAAARLVTGRPVLSIFADGDSPWPELHTEQASELLGRLHERRALLQLRSRPGLRGRELWMIHHSESAPGFVLQGTAGPFRVSGASVPDVVLVTVQGLSSRDVDRRNLPALARLAEQAINIPRAIAPRPDLASALATIMHGESPAERDMRRWLARANGPAAGQPAPDDDTPAPDASTRDAWGSVDVATPGARSRPPREDEPRRAGDSFARLMSDRGYSTAAILPESARDTPWRGLCFDFDRVIDDPTWTATGVVDAALAELAQPDPAPVFLWLHFTDLVPPPVAARPPGELATPSGTSAADTDAPDPGPDDWERLRPLRLTALDRQLERLASSLGGIDLLAITSPGGLEPLDPGERAPTAAVGPLAEVVLRVPVLLHGAGTLAETLDDDVLFSTADLLPLAIDGLLHPRREVIVTAETDDRELWGRVSSGRKTILVNPGDRRITSLRGATFDLRLDPGEELPLPADPQELDLIDFWRSPEDSPRGVRNAGLAARALRGDGGAN